MFSGNAPTDRTASSGRGDPASFLKKTTRSPGRTRAASSAASASDVEGEATASARMPKEASAAAVPSPMTAMRPDMRLGSIRRSRIAAPRGLVRTSQSASAIGVSSPLVKSSSSESSGRLYASAPSDSSARAVVQLSGEGRTRPTWSPRSGPRSGERPIPAVSPSATMLGLGMFGESAGEKVTSRARPQPPQATAAHGSPGGIPPSSSRGRSFVHDDAPM